MEFWSTLTCVLSPEERILPIGFLGDLADRPANPDASCSVRRECFPLSSGGRGLGVRTRVATNFYRPTILRIRAETSSPGIPVTAPLSISATRRRVSCFQARSTAGAAAPTSTLILFKLYEQRRQRFNFDGWLINILQRCRIMPEVALFSFLSEKPFPV